MREWWKREWFCTKEEYQSCNICVEGEVQNKEGQKDDRKVIALHKEVWNGTEVCLSTGQAR